MRPVHMFSLLFLLCVTGCSSATPDTVTSKQPQQPGSPASIAATAVAEQMNSDPDNVRILSVDAVEFGDSSLGCPQPGMAYMQVITPGYKVVAMLDNKAFDVRVAGGRGFICTSGEPATR